MRLPIAVAGLLLLAVLVGVVLAASGSSGRHIRAAPALCVSRWNEDPRALASGYHNFHSHRYAQAEVVRLGRSGNPSHRGVCAVVFPSANLDPERFAAVKVYLRGQWKALSATGGVSEVRLAELQVEAVTGANAALRADGSLHPLA